MTKDYCTFFPDKIGSSDLGACCKLHDKAYELQVPKAQADKELFDCAKDSAGLEIASLMFLGVFVCGWMFYKKAKVKR